MFVFGHMGIGLKLVSPWSKRLSKRLILVGTILPDLIDKPLYYVPAWLTGKSGAELGLIAGTRSFGHTALALIALTLLASVSRSRVLAALSLGFATHLLLDNVGDRLLSGPSYEPITLLWPLLDWNFPSYVYHDAGHHLSRVSEPYFLIAEFIGALILFWEFWKERKRREIARWVIEGRSIARKSTRGRSRRGGDF